MRTTIALACLVLAPLARADAPVPRPRECTVDEWRRVRALMPSENEQDWPRGWMREKAEMELGLEDYEGLDPCVKLAGRARETCRRDRLDEAEARSCQISLVARRAWEVTVQPDCLGWRYRLDRDGLRLIAEFGECD